MGKYNKILIAVDGSPASKNALRQAFKLAEDKKSWITVVSVVPPYEGDLELIGIRNINEVLRQPCEKSLTEAVEIAEAEKASIKTVCEEGEPYEEIVDLAESERCDLIVMGKHGKTGLERSLMGSVTARVIGHSKTDVLVIPMDTQIGWKNILVATDGSKYSNDAVDDAINYAKSYKGSLKAVCVVNVTDEFQAQAPAMVEKLVSQAKETLKAVKNKAEQAGIEIETFVREGEPYAVIVNLARQLNADTVVMGSYGRTGLKRLFMGSVTERVIGYAGCAVLVVKAE